jgi:hypothetical protein
MQNNQNNHVLGRFEVEERRKKVARMLSKSMTETAIAQSLGVDVGTVCRDKVLKQMSQQFVFDLAKGDLPFYYQQCIEGIEAVLERAWDIVDNPNISSKSTAHKLLALRVIVEANSKKFELYERGPQTLHLQTLEEKIIRIEEGNGGENRKIN